YARGVTMIAIGAVIATVGFALLNVAIAFAVSTLFAQANFSQPASYALGFVVTGGFYLLVGAIVVMLMKSRLSRQDLVPQRTVQELRKDKQWLKNEL
ncbi:MAG TPA: phage holin family protein, partial [Pyrinomonadaceae bacterium]